MSDLIADRARHATGRQELISCGSHRSSGRCPPSGSSPADAAVTSITVCRDTRIAKVRRRDGAVTRLASGP